MSIHLLKVLALALVFITSGYVRQAPTVAQVEELLLKDDFEQAERLLGELPDNAHRTALRGEIEFRKGDFKAAEVAYRDALKRDAATARAHLGLSRLAMTRLDSKQAVASIMKGVELAPQEPLFQLWASEAWGMDENVSNQLRHLEEYVRLNPTYDPDRLEEARAAVDILKAFGLDKMAVVDAPEPVAPIRLRRSLHLMFARTYINGEGPFEFALDTGASQTVISRRVADQLKLKPITSTLIHGVGGSSKAESSIFKIAQLGVGDVLIKNLPIGTFDDPFLSTVVDGIFSTALLADFIVTVNYPEGRLDLVRRTTPVDADVLPTWYFNNLLLTPITVNGRHAGHYLIDTGAVTTVLSHRTAALLGVNENTPGAKLDMGLVGVGGLDSAVLRVTDVTLATSKNQEAFPQVVSINLKDLSKQLGTEVDGILGYDFFENYKLTIDYYGGRVFLTK